MSEYTGTLGFYTLGIPVLFLRSDLLARLAPTTWDYPLEIQTPSDLQQLKDLATIRHEIRHFHDTLLTPFLFERFLVEIERNYVAARIIGKAMEKGETAPDPDCLDDESRWLLEFHHKTAVQYSQKYSGFELPVQVNAIGMMIEYSDLLETNALIIELNFVCVLHGEERAKQYWNYWQLYLPDRYTRILGTVLERSDTFSGGLARLHRAIICSLYSGGEPTREFDRLARPGAIWSGRTPEDVIPAEMLRHRIEQSRANECFIFVGFEDQYEGADQLTVNEKAALSEAKKYFIFPSELLTVSTNAFRQLAAIDFDLTAYQEKIDEFAIPPTCFYATDEMLAENILPFARKENLRKTYGDVFSICSKRDASQRTTLECGIVPTPGFKSFIPLNKVCTMLTSRYISQHLFGDLVTYTPGMDRWMNQFYSRSLRNLSIFDRN
jgi:hypothetical protein